MSARGMLDLIGTAVGGVIGWTGPPPADPVLLRQLLTRIGVPAGDTDEELADAVRSFQARTGLRTDGVAGPRTVHLLTRWAKDVRDIEHDLAA